MLVTAVEMYKHARRHAQQEERDRDLPSPEDPVRFAQFLRRDAHITGQERAPPFEESEMGHAFLPGAPHSVRL
jgi:hypothetical protein